MRVTAIGRDEQLRLLTEVMVGDAIVALVGPSGIGKSVLAATWAQARGRALFVDCFGLDAADVLRAIAATTGLHDVESVRESSVWGQLCKRLADYDAIVLDDYGSEPRLLVDLRDRTRLPLLVTAQATPDVEGVSVLPVEPFEVPTLGDFENSAAHALFVQAAREADLRYGGDDLATIHAIVSVSGGYPLGIVLAARRAAIFGAAEVLRLIELDHRATADASRPTRHQTLGNAVAFSWQQLDEDQRRRMFAMALFARPLRPSLIAAICNEDLAATLDAIADLARRGFVTRGPFPRPLEVFVDVARGSFGDESPADALAVRARIRRLAIEKARELPRGLAAPTRFHEGPSLWQYLIDSHELDVLAPDDLGAVLAAWAKWVRLAPRDDRRALERIEPHLERANDWNAWLAGVRTWITNDAERALQLARRASAVAQNDQERREALDLTAHCLTMGFRHTEAGEVFAEAVRFGQNTALTAYYRARFHNEAGNSELASRMLNEARELVDPADRTLRAIIAFQGGWCEIAPADAIASIRLAVELFAELGMTNEVAEAEMGVAELTSYFGGELNEAVEACRRAEDAKRAVHDEGGAVRARLVEARCRLGAHDFEMTEHLLRQIRSRGLDGTRIPDALLTLYEGIAALQLGQLERAEAKRQALAASAFDFANLASNRKALHVFNVGLALAVGRTDEASGLAATLDENEQFEGSLHAMIVAEHPGETTSEQLRSWTQMRPALDLTVHTLALTQAQAFVEARLTPLQRRLRVLESQDADIVAAHDFQLFRVAGDWVDLTDHPTTSTLLEALMGADEALSFEGLGAQLYPGEVVEFSALKNRVNVQLSKLRKLGLKPFISKQPDGFTLDGTTFVESSETDLK